jgi:hypothetical protein
MIPIALLVQALESRPRVPEPGPMLSQPAVEYYAEVFGHTDPKPSSGRNRMWSRVTPVVSANSPVGARDAAEDAICAWQGIGHPGPFYEVRVVRERDRAVVLKASCICEVDIDGHAHVRWLKSKRVRH